MLNYSYISPTVTSTYYWNYYSQDQNKTFSTPSSASWNDKIELSEGDRIKDFRRRLSSGELLPFTTYRRSSWVMNPGGASYAVSYPNGDRSWDSGDLRVNMAVSLKAMDQRTILSAISVLQTVNRNYLLQSAAANCYSQAYDALTTLVELPKTVEMFRDIGRRLSDALELDRAKAEELKWKRENNKQRERDQIADATAKRDRQRKDAGRRHVRNLRSMTQAAADAILEADVANIYRSFDRQIKATKSFFRRDNINLTKAINGVTSDYLTVRYGLRPLLYDMENLQKLYHGYNKESPKVVISHSSQSEPLKTSLSTDSNGIGGVQTKTVTHDYTINYRATVSARFTPSKIQLNPVVTAWEATRLSFVVDWFLNVGNYIEQLSLQALSTQIVACMSERITGTTTITYQSKSNAPDVSSFNSYGSGSVRLDVRTRMPAGLPSLPQAKVRLDNFKIADIVALVSQSFLKSKKQSKN